MVSMRQKKTIEEKMRKIREAKAQNMSDEEIERRTTELYNYLEAEGIIHRYE